MTYRCRKCQTAYVVATIGTREVFMAVEPWTTRLCAACDIDAPRQ